MQRLTIILLILLGYMTLQAQNALNRQVAGPTFNPEAVPENLGVCESPPVGPEGYARERTMYKAYYKKGLRMRENSRTNRTVIYVTAHRVWPGSCTFLDPGATAVEVEADINKTNDMFDAIGFNVHLELVGNERVCDQDFWEETQLTTSNMGPYHTEYGVDGHLNIYYANTTSRVMGFPWDTINSNQVALNNVFVHKQQDAGWGWTVAHEIGHWFGLLHTFQGAYAGISQGEEGVSRTPGDCGYNCETHGDLLCDTPADYVDGWCLDSDDNCSCNVQGQGADCSNAGFTLSPASFDNCGEQYQPDLLNIMSYGCRPCADYWTGGQVTRMWTYLPVRLKQSSITHGSCRSNTDDLTPQVIDVPQRIEVDGYLGSTQHIETTLYTLYDASGSISLKPGFRAEPYGPNNLTPNFEVLNEGCYGDQQLTKPGETKVIASDVQKEVVRD